MALILAAAATAGVAAAVYRWHTGFGPPSGGGRPVLPDTLAYSDRAGRAPSPGAVATQPDADLLSGLVEIALGGLEIVDADPAGLVPPPGARRLSAVRQNSAAGRRQLGRYLAKAAPGAVESHYADTLADAGWKLAGTRADGGTVYVRQRQHCLVRVTPAGQETEVLVVVTTLPE